MYLEYFSFYIITGVVRALFAILLVASVKIKAESFQSCGFQILLRKSFLEILFMVGQTIVPLESVRSKGTTQPKALVLLLAISYGTTTNCK